MKEIFKKYFSSFFFVILSCSSLLLINENPSKAIFLIFLFTLWYLCSKKLGVYKSTLLFIFLLIPLNITFQIPESINIFDIQILLSDPYVAGFWVNYLVPTLSVLDIFVSILFINIFLNNGFKGVFKKDLLFFILLLGILLLTVHNFLTALLWVRMLVYLLTSIAVVNSLKEKKSVKKLLQEGYVKLSLTGSILIQGSIGILQFIKGTSIGLYFLGESKIVNGMFGSSFIEIQGETLLRAYGTFPHPNILAGWFLLLMFMSYILYNYSKDRFYLLPLLLVPIFSIFTFSRISIILIALFSLFLLVQFFLKRRYTYSLSSILFYRFLYVFTGGDSSFTDRIKLIKVNWEIFLNNLHLGTTLGNSTRFYSENIPFTDGGKLLLQPVHNIFLLSFVEMGIFLATYFWYVIYKYFVMGIRKSFLPLFILFSIIMIGMGDHYFLTLPQGNAIFFSFLILLSGSE